MIFFLFLLFPALSVAGVWPNTFGAFHRAASQPVQVSDRPLWDEYGLQLAEQAQYELGTRKFTATAYQLQDSTGALGVFDWQRPSGARPSALAKLAVEAGDSTMLAHGNYVLLFQGYKPSVAEIGALYQSLPKLDQSPLPTLSGYLDHLPRRSGDVRSRYPALDCGIPHRCGRPARRLPDTQGGNETGDLLLPDSPDRS